MFKKKQTNKNYLLTQMTVLKLNNKSFFLSNYHKLKMFSKKVKTNKKNNNNC